MALIEISDELVGNEYPLLTRDELNERDFNKGVRFIFDIAYSNGHTLIGTAKDGDVVEDLTDIAPGTFRVPDGGVAPPIAGNGIDFGSASVRSTGIEIPKSVSKTIFENGQRFLVVLYVKMNEVSDWVSQVQELPILSFGNTSTGYRNGHDWLAFGFGTQSSTRQFWVRRQTAEATAESVALSSNTLEAHAGKLAQIAVWRDGTGLYCRIKSAGGVNQSAVGPNNIDSAINFSDQPGLAGIPFPFWGSPFQAVHLSARKFKIYRGFIEALQVTGRSPVAVIDADWNRVVQRAAFA